MKPCENCAAEDAVNTFEVENKGEMVLGTVCAGLE